MKQKTLVELLDSVLEKANGQPLSIGEIFTTLQHRGFALLIVVFTAPFLFPFQIPGLSVPFGIATIFLGLKIAMPSRKVLPKRILARKFSYPTLEKWIKRTQWILKKVNKFVFHRLASLALNDSIVHFNGWCIAILSLVFIIPIPLPLTNFLAAIPIFMIALGMLEQDGLFILVGYFFGLFCIAAFIAVIWLGYLGIEFIHFNYLKQYTYLEYSFLR